MKRYSVSALATLAILIAFWAYTVAYTLVGKFAKSVTYYVAIPNIDESQRKGTMSLAPVWLVFALAIPLGLFLALVGAVVFFATRYKKASVAVIALGLVISVGTLASLWFLWPR